MSNNKYIIDKDSLTGIADAVRDQLGVGSSIDDENAGYYPTTGYVLKFNTPQKRIDGLNTSVIFSMTNGNEQIQTWCGKIPEKIRFTRASNPFYTSVYCNGVEVLSSSGGSANEKTNIISYPANGQITITEYNGKNSYAVTPYAITIEFLDNDKNSLGVINGDTSFNYNGTTISFLTGSYNVAIPFTLDDIQDRITNYLGKKSTIKTKLFITRYTSQTTQAQYGKYSNYLWATSAYNYNVGPSDPTYITTKIPNLRPENIIYMAVITANNREKRYQFRSENYPMQHYTASSQSGSGNRLTTATDYYFFPNGCEFKTYSENYGLLAHWDKNNSILDLQGVLKSSGTIDGTITASSSAYLNPYMLYIIYEEATE